MFCVWEFRGGWFKRENSKRDTFSICTFFNFDVSSKCVFTYPESVPKSEKIGENLAAMQEQMFCDITL